MAQVGALSRAGLGRCLFAAMQVPCGCPASWGLLQFGLTVAVQQVAAAAHPTLPPPARLLLVTSAAAPPLTCAQDTEHPHPWSHFARTRSHWTGCVSCWRRQLLPSWQLPVAPQHAGRPALLLLPEVKLVLLSSSTNRLSCRRRWIGCYWRMQSCCGTCSPTAGSTRRWSRRGAWRRLPQPARSRW